MFKRFRFTFIAVFVTMIAVGATLLTFNSANADLPEKKLVVVGDSITARYNDISGDANEGWWSMVGHEMGYTPVKVAVSGVGFMRKQPDCSGIRFGGMLSQVIAEQPDILIIAGGRNDWRDCASSSHASEAKVRDHAFRYFRALNARLGLMGITSDDVYMMSPWGAAASSHMWIRSVVKDEGERFGFTWIPTSYLQDGHGWSVDRTHPTLAGNVELKRRVLKFSDLLCR